MFLVYLGIHEVLSRAGRGVIGQRDPTELVYGGYPQRFGKS